MNRSSEFYFIDANIPMYAAGSEHPLKAPCKSILEAIAQNKIMAVTDAEVLQEILHRYSALRRHEQGIDVCRTFLKVVPTVLPVTVADIHQAMDVIGRFPRLQARDALHIAVMLRRSISHVITADRHFDGIPGIQRVDPVEASRLFAS